ncbi:MAG: O-antigen ligase family protein [Patescibacteria group bacterium]
MDSILSKKIFYFLGGFVLLEALSLVAFSWPVLGPWVFILVLIASFTLAIYRLEYGLLLLVAEMIIASKGYLFSWGPWSWRLALFVIIIIAWLYHALKAKNLWSRLRQLPLPYYFSGLLLFCLIGAVQGYLHYGLSSNWWPDLNGWLFFAILPALAFVYYKNPDKKVYERLALVALAAVIWLGLKTLVFFFIFSHDFSWSYHLYRWIRVSGVGEITNIGFNWPRIFLQSQVYAPIAFLGLLFFPSKKFAYHVLLTLCLMTTLISFSRSFWAGLLLAYIFAAFILIKRNSLKIWLKQTLLVAGLTAGSLVLIYVLAFFPYPKSLVSFSPDLFQRRANFLESEAAIASRWSLLKPLWQKAWQEPVLGQGFGTLVSYHSSDPRILELHPDGYYTTYAFEWAYLDILLKIGLLGLLAYLVLLGRILRQGFKNSTPLKAAIISALVFLIVTNVFTPYLNHPLGIAYLLFSSCLIF